MLISTTGVRSDTRNVKSKSKKKQVGFGKREAKYLALLALQDWLTMLLDTGELGHSHPETNKLLTKAQQKSIVREAEIIIKQYERRILRYQRPMNPNE